MTAETPKKFTYVNPKLRKAAYLSLLLFSLSFLALGEKIVSLFLKGGYFSIWSSGEHARVLRLVGKIKLLTIIEMLTLPLLIVVAVLCFILAWQAKRYVWVQKLGVGFGITWLVLKCLSLPTRYTLAKILANPGEFTVFQVMGLGDIAVLLLGVLQAVLILMAAREMKRDCGNLFNA